MISNIWQNFTTNLFFFSILQKERTTWWSFDDHCTNYGKHGHNIIIPWILATSPKNSVTMMLLRYGGHVFSTRIVDENIRHHFCSDREQVQWLTVLVWARVLDQWGWVIFDDFWYTFYQLYQYKNGNVLKRVFSIADMLNYCGANTFTIAFLQITKDKYLFISCVENPLKSLFQRKTLIVSYP